MVRKEEKFVQKEVDAAAANDGCYRTKCLQIISQNPRLRQTVGFQSEFDTCDPKRLKSSNPVGQSSVRETKSKCQH